MDSRGKEILEQLLRERTPEERERLSLAWERTAGGDPESLPVLFALSDRFSLEAHAALVGEMRRIQAGLESMAQEIGKGAQATVKRMEGSAAATLDHVDQFGELIPRLDQMARVREEACLRLVSQVEESARNIGKRLHAARQEHDQTLNRGMMVFYAVLVALVVGLGFWSGGELRAWRERERTSELLHLYGQGDPEARRELSERINDYRKRHKLSTEKTP